MRAGNPRNTLSPERKAAMANKKKSGNGLVIVGGLVVLALGGAGVAFALSGSSKAKSASNTRTAELQARTTAALANVEVQKALAQVEAGKMQAGMFKAKMKSMNIPFADRLLSGIVDIGVQAGTAWVGSLDFGDGATNPTSGFMGTGMGAITGYMPMP